MSKYTPEQLRAMAQWVVKNRDDQRTDILIARLSAATGFGPRQTAYKIHVLAK